MSAPLTKVTWSVCRSTGWRQSCFWSCRRGRLSIGHAPRSSTKAGRSLSQDGALGPGAKWVDQHRRQHASGLDKSAAGVGSCDACLCGPRQVRLSQSTICWDGHFRRNLADACRQVGKPACTASAAGLAASFSRRGSSRVVGWWRRTADPACSMRHVWSQRVSYHRQDRKRFEAQATAAERSGARAWGERRAERFAIDPAEEGLV